MQGILGIKKGMTQIFNDQGLVVPVTIVEAEPNFVTQIKTVETDGYNSVQIAHGSIKEKNVTKPAKGHFDKASVAAKRNIKEFTFSDQAELKAGDEVSLERFEEGSLVTVVGTSKGKGFQGVVKRHNFAGSRRSHGQSSMLRAPGSIGQSSSPSRVFKGIKMGGRMGGERISVKDVEIVKIDTEKNLLYLRGSLPGAKNSLLEIKN